MNLPDNWRNLGRAMRWARQQEGVTAPRTALDNRRDAPAVELTWQREDGLTVSLWRLRSNRLLPDLSINFPDRPDGSGKVSGIDGVDSATEALRVLAALELIPVEIAYAADERYGRCQACGRMARWWADLDTPSWVHIQPWAVTGPAAHRAEVAE